MSGRPLDELEAAVGDDVEVHLKSDDTISGTLAGYDQHMNLVLDEVGTTPASADADDPAGNGQDTTIIRGDNVVSITL
ncbi:LSM domain-containing protein [Salinarchaeum laminariae]|uniref:LSM domain-containing protein n=1 Tax=Salinarchaeum laminariae TaxID=869888 RepID=UPI0020BDBBC6|nr:LSM domain-containing protein [Salinarchaeum laminariae]